MLGYFLAADLLGFGAIIRNSNDQERKVRVDRWVGLVESSAAAEGIIDLQLVSDTVFAGAPDTVEGLRALVRFSRRLLNEGVHVSLPIRGGIVHGEYEFGRLTYGQAVVDAHNLESAQDWVGVCGAAGLPRASDLWARDLLVVYPVPFKRGEMRLHPAVGWDVPHALPLLALLGQGGLVPSTGDVVSWEVGIKANNTVQFGTYLELVARAGGEFDMYAGLLPMDLIERAALGVQVP